MPQKCAYFTLNLPNGFYLCHFFRDKDGKRPEFMPMFVFVHAYVRFRSCLCSPAFMPIFFHEDAFVFQPLCPRIYQDFPIRSYLEFIPAFYKECFRGFLFVLMRSIAGYVTNKNGEKDRKQI